MTLLRTWYLVRHGETEWNVEGRMQGRLDSPLSATGRGQAIRTGETLARLGVDHVFASPLGRVRETLTIIEPYVSLPAVFDDRLVEWSAGDWSGRRYADIRKEEPERFAAWQADRFAVCSPNGESFADVDARAASFLADAATVPHARIAILAHGFLNRLLARRLLDLTPADTVALRQANDTIFRIRVSDAGTVVDHFRGDDGPFPGLTCDPLRAAVVQTP